MSTESVAMPVPVPVKAPLSPDDLAILLVKHYGLHEGRYKLLFEFQIGVGGVGPSQASLAPGLLIGLSKFGLMATTEEGPLTVDAAVVNPVKKSRKKSS